ncbi:thermonuclease family protein [Roseateles sp. PN1]|uniref:thermonuclease family protein n=1 Tax=Roseateles sp. PN1 TaxID=3137372 RepID=UPI0031386738
MNASYTKASRNTSTLQPLVASCRRFLLGLSLALLAGTCPASTIDKQLDGRVVGVADGDTITVLDQTTQPHKIRLAGIDAPEKHQAFGQRAKQNLSDLVYGKNVSVVWRKKDRYGRIIGKVMVGPVDACLTQLSQGMAWHYKQYEKDQPAAERRSYAAAEQLARQRELGLWHEEQPTAPWDFRRR